MEDFRAAVRDGVRIADLALLVAVPAVLVAVALLPEAIRTGLVLDYGDPTLLTLWSSAYVHRSADHLLDNVVAYGVMIAPSYLLFVLAGERRLFRATLLGFLLVLPPVLGTVDVLVLREGTGAGFSGIASAVVGLLPVGVFLFVGHRVSAAIDPADGVGFFLLVAAGIAATYTGLAEAAVILLFAVLLTLHSATEIGAAELRRAGAELASMDGYLQLILLGAGLFVVSPVLLFPADLVQGGNAVNILGHYVGLVVGFFGPTVYATVR